MAADNITEARFHFEGPTSPASFGMHYQETVPHSTGGFAVRRLVQALILALKAPIVAVLSNDWKLASMTVRVKSVANEPFVREDVFAGLGLRAGPALPANMSWIIKESQATFPPKSNGRIYVPGLGEPDTLVGVLTSVFLTGTAQALADALALTIEEAGGGAGRWEPGIISPKVRDAGPPPKDWEGAFAPIESMTAWSIISSQRKRKTKVIGAAQV
jgi:hypothetical protein